MDIISSSHYSRLLDYVKQLAESDPLVNRVSEGTRADLDLDKATLFPLLNVLVDDVDFSNPATVGFSVELTALGLVNSSNEIANNDFYKGSNEVDILNTTSIILNRITSRIATERDGTGITVESVAGTGSIRENGANTYSGWQVTLTVSMPNNELNLCQYPI
tara:strand:+ start:625 stop:1110 length:486 start_codon:yes stop_codon:yes gene_type:complete